MTGDSWFFIGRAERLALAILLALTLAGLGLYAFSRPQEEISTSRPAEHKLSDSLLRTRDYVGPPQALSHKTSNKFAHRTVLDLNGVDSLTLLRVPGIGPAFTHRILALRSQLGGYYTVLQLQEVYGMDEDKYLALRGWFAIRTAPKRYFLDSLQADELPEHRYLSWAQRKALTRLLYRHGHLSSWRQIMKDPAFSHDDSVRLSHYLIERKHVDSLEHDS